MAAIHNLILYFEFEDGTETLQWTFEDARGIPIPTIGDCINPGKGEYKILSRTFSFDDPNFTIYFNCEPDSD